MAARKNLLFSIIAVILFFIGIGDSWAKADLSLNVSDITFSKGEALAGEKTRIFGRVFNLGDEDVSGYVIFYLNNKAIGDPQVVSVRVGTYDDVFIDWVFEKGEYDIGAGIVGTQPKDEEASNNVVLKKDYFVDSDADKDGIGDALDNDSDNDGLSNAQEILSGTDPFKADTDNDGVNDREDKFPLDKNEQYDTDGDKIGNNADLDDDNDGLTDAEELALGTDPLKVDTDGDFIPDKTEARIGFLKPDRNEWSLVANKLASMAGAVAMAIESGDTTISYLFAAFGFLSIVLLTNMFLHKK